MTARSGAVRIVHADFVLGAGDQAIGDGAVVIDDTGLVLDLGRAGEILPAHAGAPSERVEGVLSPAFINAHTHIELSALRGKIPGGHGFVPWVEWMIALRLTEEPHQDQGAITQAVRELDEAGTAAVGDVENTDVAVPALRRAGIGGIGFREVAGLDPDRACQSAAYVSQELAAGTAAAADSGADFVLSAAPHTVYTTHPDAVRVLLALARSLGRQSTVHLAEHGAERTFLEDGTGPFVDFAKRTKLFSPRFPVYGKGPIDVAADLGLLAPDVLLVHLTDARREEILRIADSGAQVVLCPRSNLFIENRLPPIANLIEAGIVPALGTDSLASNRSLDVLAEANVLYQSGPDVSARILFEMMTAAGARALNRPDLGRIARGTRPGLLAFEGTRPSDDPFAWLVGLPSRRRRWIARRGPSEAHP